MLVYRLNYMLTSALLGFTLNAAANAAINIENCEQLQSIGNNPAMPLDGEYYQSNDIDCAAIPNFAPIGSHATPFTGYYNGQGNSIINLRIHSTDLDPSYDEYVGLFRYLSYATIENIQFNSYTVTSTAYEGSIVGALAGMASHSTIHNIHGGPGIVYNEILGTMPVPGQTGGLLGYLVLSELKDSSSDANVTGMGNVGGLVGNGYSVNISNNHASGDVTATPDPSNSSYGSAGGLIGNLDFSSLDNSSATGDVVSLDTRAVGAGGLIGRIDGQMGYSAVTQCYASGNVSGTNFVGGLFGFSGVIVRDSYATGHVSGATKVGGLIGYAAYNSITNTYATGRVIGTAVDKSTVGGLIGSNDWAIAIDASYWDMDTTGQQNSRGGEGRTTKQMQLIEYDPVNYPIYVGWTDREWTFKQGYYPVLK